MEAVQSKLDKLQSAYLGFAAGDLNPLYESLSEDVVWYSHSNPMAPYYGVHRGIKSIEAYFSDLSASEIKKVEVHSLLENGDKAIALIDILCVGRESGASTEEQYVHVLRIEEGLVTQVDIYKNKIDV